MRSIRTAKLPRCGRLLYTDLMGTDANERADFDHVAPDTLVVAGLEAARQEHEAIELGLIDLGGEA